MVLPHGAMELRGALGLAAALERDPNCWPRRCAPSCPTPA
jgi:hypothetical protein